MNMFDTLIKEGIIPFTLKNHKIIYEDYLLEKSKGFTTTKAISNISEKNKISEDSVYRIIRRMKL